MKLLRPGGRNVLFGLAEASGTRRNLFRAAKAMASFGLIHPIQMLNGSKSILGVNLLHIADSAPAVLARCLKSVVDAARRNELRLEPATVFDANEIARAHEALASRQTTGKVVLRWQK